MLADRWSCAVIVMCTLAGGVRAETSGELQVSGHGSDLWIVRDQGEDHLLLHRRRDDDPGQLRRVATLPGALHADGLAAGLSRVWIVQSNQGIRLVRYDRDETSGLVHYTRPAILPRLPRGLTLRRSAGAKRRLWALAEGPPDVQVGRATEGDVEAGDDRPSGAQDRLLFLDGTRWHDFPMPPQWPHGAAAQLVVSAGSGPRLVAWESEDAVVLFRYGDDQWHRTAATWSGGDHTPVALVDAQLVLGAVDRAVMPPAVRLYFARDGIVSFGSVALLAADEQWRLAATDDHATVVARQGDVLRWSQVNLQGRVVTPSTPFEIGHALSLDRATDFVLWMGTLITATLIMFLFWKRDPQSNRAELPASMVLADLVRRMAAGAIDLAPCMVVAMLLFRVSADQILARWPGHAGSVTRMAPSGTVILLFVGHTLLTEALTGRSMGKFLLGLRVTDLAGRRATWKQVILRNVMKALDLVAPPLLILPLAGPQKQRLGDMVARTVVVTGSDAAASENEDHESEMVGGAKDREDTDGT